MSDRPAADRSVRVVGDAPRAITPAATRFSWALALAGVAAFVVLVATGGGVPPVVPALLLVVVLALCVNRVALYPSDLAATAELAVLLCAVVAFRDVAPVTGPLLLGLVVGPLDTSHWRRRSFVRMAYNSGNRGLASMGAAGAFAAGVATLGTAPVALAAATVMAACAAALLDGLATVGLVRCLGGSARATRRELLDIDALALPLAVAGGAVGFLATGVGWWAAALPLALLALLPELLQARARIPARFARDVLLAIELAAILLVTARVGPVPSWPTVFALGIFAVVIGAELIVDRHTPVPPGLGIAVGAVALVVGQRSAIFAAVLVAALATATAWSLGKRSTSGTACVGVAIAGAGGALAAVPTRIDSEAWRILAVALGGLACFAVVSVVVARGPRLALLVDVGWAAPLVAGPVACAVLAEGAPAVVVSLSAVVLVVSAVLGAWCGSTPWRSRLVSRRLGGLHGGGRVVVFVGLCAIAATTAALALVWDDLGAANAVVVFASGGAATTMAAFAIRQWRFAPHTRRSLGGGLLVTTAALCVAVALVASGSEVAAGTLCLATLALVALIGRRSVQVSDRIV